MTRIFHVCVRSCPILLLGAHWIASTAAAGDGRTEISQDMMPLTIDSPGSYVLTENLTASPDRTASGSPPVTSCWT